MDKDHVVIGLDTYESIKKAKDLAEEKLQEAEAKLNLATNVISKIIFSASKSHSLSMHPSEGNAHNIVTEAGYSITIETGAGKILCGRGETRVLFTKK